MARLAKKVPDPGTKACFPITITYLARYSESAIYFTNVIKTIL